jgi:predicted metal-dependent HD superfamily phosphohydrolase
MKNKKITEITDSIKLTQLKENFFEIFGKYTDEIKVKKLWKQFVRIYTGPSRHYHNIHHIAHMVNLWKVNHSLLEKSDEIFFAIIYHDVVYRSRWKNNERKSLYSWGHFPRYFSRIFPDTGFIPFAISF